MTLRLHSLPRSFAAIAAVAVCIAARSARAADLYDRSFARAREASLRGDWRGAARALEPAVAAYPQDYAVAVALGDARLRAEQFDDSERAYRLALERAPDAADARIGLERAVSARDATATRTAPWSLAAAWNQFYFPAHPYKSSGLGFLADASRTFGREWLVDGAYRFVRYAVTTSPYVSPFAQHEGYARAGWDAEGGALLVEGAVVGDGSGLYGLSTHAGGTARWSRFGDALLHGSASVYRDLVVARIAPQWRIPIAGPLSILPGAAVQIASGRAFPNANLTAIAEWPALTAWAGAKYGAEVRPAYLESHVVYDIPERVEWGAWLGVRLRISRALAAQATYAFDRLRRTDAVAPLESDIHAIALGPALRF